jgi:hypothetical protein
MKEAEKGECEDEKVSGRLRRDGERLRKVKVRMRKYQEG